MLSQAYKGSKIRSKSYTFCSKVTGTVRRPIGFRPLHDPKKKNYKTNLLNINNNANG